MFSLFKKKQPLPDSDSEEEEEAPPPKKGKGKEKGGAKAGKKAPKKPSSPDHSDEAEGPAEEPKSKKKDKKESKDGKKVAKEFTTDGGKVKKKEQPDNKMETLGEEDEEEAPRPKKKKEPEEHWKEVAERLPVHKTPEDRETRKDIFETWDPKGTGVLTLAQIDKGIKKTEGLGQLHKCKPAIIRAYNAAKTLKTEDKDEDFVSSVEFRMLLVFLKLYFGLFNIFQETDTGADRQIEEEEFMKAVPELKEWGCEIDDAEEAFEEIDEEGEGTVAFDEVAEWAIANNALVSQTGGVRQSLEPKLQEAKEEPKEEEEAPKKGGRRGSAIDDLMANDWKEIGDRLPVHKTEEDGKKRKDMFKRFDPNGNGMLSLAEVDKGLNESPGLEKLYKCKPALIRAFNAAKGIKPGDPKKKGLQDDDYVSFVEFRMLLVYLKLYYGLFRIFDEIDTGDDRRVDITEFKAAAPQLREWGCEIDDPEETFKQVDSDGHGQILFDEFSAWAIKNNCLITAEEAEDKEAAPANLTPEEVKRLGSGLPHGKAVRESTAIPTPANPRQEEPSETEGDDEEEEEEEEPAQSHPEHEEKMSAEWKTISNTLPWRKSVEDTKRRKKLFKAFDPNGNGLLSLAEVDKALQVTPGLDPLFRCKPAVIRAFNAAKNIKPADPNKKGPLSDDDYVSRLEFRMLLVYLKLYYGLFQIFESIDSGGDRRVDKDEFRQAADELREWGLPIADNTDDTFKEIDDDGAGQILFDEFSKWAIKHNMLNDADAAPSQEPTKIKLGKKSGGAKAASAGGPKKPPSKAPSAAGDLSGDQVLEKLLSDYDRVENKVNALNKELLDMRKQIVAAMGGPK